MTEIMTASVEGDITDGQLASAENQLSDAIRKHGSEIPKDVFQKVLGVPNLGMQLFAVIRKLAEEISKQIVHIVEVNRDRSLLDTLKACGRKLYVDERVLATAPRGTGNKVKMTYFELDSSEYENGAPTCAALDRAYKKRGLKPDLQAQTDDNAANPELADTKPNACQWVDADGNYCYATFYRWFDERRVRVYRHVLDWFDKWSFGGVPDESSASAV